jgi:hypothetical protein
VKRSASKSASTGSLVGASSSTNMLESFNQPQNLSKYSNPRLTLSPTSRSPLGINEGTPSTADKPRKIPTPGGNPRESGLSPRILRRLSIDGSTIKLQLNKSDAKLQSLSGNAGAFLQKETNIDTAVTKGLTL